MKTLHAFSLAVASEVAGVPVAQVEGFTEHAAENAAENAAETGDGERFGIDLTRLIDFIGQLVTILSDCPLSDSDAARAMEKPTWKQKLRLRVEARKLAKEQSASFTWRERHEAICECCEKVSKGLTASDREAIIADTRAPDYNVL